MMNNSAAMNAKEIADILAKEYPRAPSLRVFPFSCTMDNEIRKALFHEETDKNGKKTMVFSYDPIETSLILSALHQNAWGIIRKI